MNSYLYINIIRHVAAILVIYAHSFELMKTSEVDYFKYFTGGDLGYIAVNIFFFLSGMLIYNSAKNSSSLQNYFLKRFLRIYPALFVCIVLTTFIFWIDSSFSFKAYFFNEITIKYILNLFFIGNYTAFSVFDENHYQFVANGSLWTLRYEVLMYIITSIFVFTKMNSNKLYLYSLTLFFCLLFIITLNEELSMLKNIARLGTYFFIGAVLSNVQLYKYKKIVLVIFLISLISLITMSLFKNIFIFIIIVIGLKYSIEYIQNNSTNNNKFNFDISYGLYIYAFPVQQFLIKYIVFNSVYLYILYALFITSLLAYLSWILIEKNALRYKNVIE